MPSHERPDDLRGLIDDVQLLKNQRNLSKYIHVDNFTDVSKLEGFTLEKYIVTFKKLCKTEHAPSCTTCSSFIAVAKHIAENGFIRLSTAFSITSPTVKYKSKDAKRKLLQMPLAALRIKLHESNAIYLVAKNNNLTLARSILSKVDCRNSKGEENYMTKTCVKELLKAAESDAERERITFAISQASGHSNTKLRKLYGFEDLSKRKERVEHALREAKEIREALEDIASIQEKALLRSFGIEVESDSSTEDDESELDTEDDNSHCLSNSEIAQTSNGNLDTIAITPKPRPINHQTSNPSICENPDEVLDILKSCRLNWFEFVAIIKEKMKNQTKEFVDHFLLRFREQNDQLKLNEHEKYLLEQSKRAFDIVEKEESTNSDLEEENIQSDIEENYVDWGAIRDPLQGEGK